MIKIECTGHPYWAPRHQSFLGLEVLVAFWGFRIRMRMRNHYLTIQG